MKRKLGKYEKPKNRLKIDDNGDSDNAWMKEIFASVAPVTERTMGLTEENSVSKKCFTDT